MTAAEKEREACANIIMARAVMIEQAAINGLMRGKRTAALAEAVRNQLVDCYHEIMNRGEKKKAQRKSRG